METPEHATSVMLVLDGTTPAPEVAEATSRLLPPDTAWTVVVVTDEHPVHTTGATGFAAPVLSPDEMENRARADRVEADAAAAATARALGDQAVRQVVGRGDVVDTVRALLEAESCDVVVAASTDLAEHLTHNDISPVLVVPSASIVDPEAPILIAVDDSPLDERILSTVAALFGPAPEILTLNVAPSVPPGVSTTAFGTLGVSMPTDLGDTLADDAQQAADRATGRVGFRDVTPVGAVGDPVNGILEVADEHGVAMIVLGSRDRSWFSRLLRPSVSDAVRRRTDRPVLILR